MAFTSIHLYKYYIFLIFYFRTRVKLSAIGITIMFISSTLCTTFRVEIPIQKFQPYVFRTQSSPQFGTYFKTGYLQNLGNTIENLTTKKTGKNGMD